MKEFWKQICQGYFTHIVKINKFANDSAKHQTSRLYYSSRLAGYSILKYRQLT